MLAETITYYMSEVNCKWHSSVTTYLFHITGITPGSVVITDTAVDSFFKPRFEQIILDNIVTRSTELDKALAEELFNYSKEIPNFPALIGHTMCTYDFYEGEKNL